MSTRSRRSERSSSESPGGRSATSTRSGPPRRCRPRRWRRSPAPGSRTGRRARRPRCGGWSNVMAYGRLGNRALSDGIRNVALPVTDIAWLMPITAGTPNRAADAVGKNVTAVFTLALASGTVQCVCPHVSPAEGWWVVSALRTRTNSHRAEHCTDRVKRRGVRPARSFPSQRSSDGPASNRDLTQAHS